MSANILLTTLGERPAAITMALDWLLPQFQYKQLVLLHTDAERSLIAQPLIELETEIARHRPYQGLTKQRWPMCDNGMPIVDTDTQMNSEAYFRALVDCFRHFRKQSYRVHVLISGGRKAMSAYAVVAASYVLSYEDRLWTSTVDKEFIRDDMWHLPPGSESALSVVNLPFKASRLTRGQLQDVTLSDLVWDNRTDNMSQRLVNEDFTEAERRVAEALRNQPYATSQQIASMLGVGIKTVETHLRSMYQKAGQYWNVPTKNRRAFLRDVLDGHI